MNKSASRIALAMALLITLDGCVAAAIPVLAGAAGARSRLRHKTAAAQRRGAVTTPAPSEVAAAVPPQASPPPPTVAAAAPDTPASPAAVGTANRGRMAMGPPVPAPDERVAAVAREPYRTLTVQPPAKAPAKARAKAMAPAPTQAQVQLANDAAAARRSARAPRVRVAEVPVAPVSRTPVAALAPLPVPVALSVPVAPEEAVRAPMLRVADGPQPAHVRGDYSDFARFALAQAQPMSGGAARTSVVYDPESSLEAPRFYACDQLAPAVLIDLDPAGATLSPAHAGGAAPGLGDALAAVRAAGLVVLWATDLPTTLAPEVYRTLRASGLDPEGTDRLLLNRTSDERKELRKRAAARDYCIVASAGDKRGDFAELFDYLRIPSAAAALEPRFGAGWFMVPPPLGTGSQAKD